MDLKWACGVTTVPSRRTTTLPGTIASLYAAGFLDLRLFIDGCSNGDVKPYKQHYPGLGITTHDPPVHAFGNFWLGLLEMYLREPLADLYGLFQDDVLICKNTKLYLEATIPSSCEERFHPPYFNLITVKHNEDLIREKGIGWHHSNQLGWGAQGLIFPRQTMFMMFQSRHMVERPQGMRNGVPDPPRAWKNLDGGVCASIKSCGGIELVHYPSLIYHVEGPSAIGNQRDGRMTQGTWLGEAFDTMTLIGKAELVAV